MSILSSSSSACSSIHPVSLDLGHFVTLLHTTYVMLLKTRTLYGRSVDGTVFPIRLIRQSPVSSALTIRTGWSIAMVAPNNHERIVLRSARCEESISRDTRGLNECMYRLQYSDRAPVPNQCAPENTDSASSERNALGGEPSCVVYGAAWDDTTGRCVCLWHWNHSQCPSQLPKEPGLWYLSPESREACGLQRQLENYGHAVASI